MVVIILYLKGIKEERYNKKYSSKNISILCIVQISNVHDLEKLKNCNTKWLLMESWNQTQLSSPIHVKCPMKSQVLDLISNLRRRHIPTTNSISTSSLHWHKSAQSMNSEAIPNMLRIGFNLTHVHRKESPICNYSELEFKFITQVSKDIDI